MTTPHIRHPYFNAQPAFPMPPDGAPRAVISELAVLLRVEGHGIIHITATLPPGGETAHPPMGEWRPTTAEDAAEYRKLYSAWLAGQRTATQRGEAARKAIYEMRFASPEFPLWPGRDAAADAYCAALQEQLEAVLLETIGDRMSDDVAVAVRVGRERWADASEKNARRAEAFGYGGPLGAEPGPYGVADLPTYVLPQAADNVCHSLRLAAA